MDRITPGLQLQPWKQPWQVCFVPCWQHWTMRPFRMKPPYQHVFLLRPFETVAVGQSRWIYLEWSFMGIVCKLLDYRQAAPLHDMVMRDGAMIFYPGSSFFPPPRMGNGLWPLTCVTFVRQALGLPFRFRVWTPEALWHELLAAGGKIVVAQEVTMSFVSQIFGGGGGDGGGGSLGYDIINAQRTEENRLKDETRRFDELALKAGNDARTLGIVQSARAEQTVRNPNPWITSGSGYTGLPGASRSLGGTAFQLGT